MGCKGSKSKKNAYARVAQYQKESWAAERSVKAVPQPLDWVTPDPSCITPSCLHNLLTDGFYSPFVSNPRYLLLVDCRPLEDFEKRTLMTAHWYGHLHQVSSPESFLSIVLFDDITRTSPPSLQENGPLSKLYFELKKRRLDPKAVIGGWPTIKIICSHLTVPGESLTAFGSVSIPWYPTLIIPGFLFLGQSEMASNSQILIQLRISHVVALSDVVPRRVLPSTNYLVVPLAEGDPVIENDKDNSSTTTQGPDLISSMPTLLDFVMEAKTFGGSVLVFCDQGLTRAAVVVMALLMAERRCSLEDAFYYVKAARSAVHPHLSLLKELESYETSLFGVPLTAIDELF